MDLATVDELLTTTRAVRKRFDLKRPVEPEVVEECLRLALQAPTGSARQHWHFLVVTDPELRRCVAEVYSDAFNVAQRRPRATYAEDDPRAAVVPRVMDSAHYLAAHMHEVPVLVIPCIQARVLDAPLAAQASAWGSILPATWSFMLALRSRGLGSVWTSAHLMQAERVAKLLDIPEDYTQAALIPVAYYKGEGFRPASRLPLDQVSSWDRWGQARG